MPNKRHSELECFILGLIWRAGPCTPYEVRRLLSDSPSTQWSASAGAIYPLVQRLERAGLLKSRSDRTGRRRSRLYSVTPRGTRTLRQWVGPPLAPEAVTVSHDPLRSRARFLDVLPAADRLAWAAAAGAALDEVDRRIDRWHALYAAVDDPIAPLMTASGRLDVGGRREWLQEVTKAIGIAAEPARGGEPGSGSAGIR
jgi:DNA-binding PadR family transcriptional regulator